MRAPGRHTRERTGAPGLLASRVLPRVRTLLVGDVHGCLDELDRLLAAAGFREGDDALVSVGDLVGKGPAPAGVVDRLRALGGRAVRGNHDQRVLDVAARREAGEEVPSGTHLDAARALSPEALRWLAETPFVLELPEHDAVVVHGGLVPGVPLDRQDPSTVMNLRSLRPDGSPSRRLDDGAPWAASWPGPALAVFGHDAVRGLQEYPHAYGLDTGCVYGGWLTGLWLPDRALVQVRAGAPYAAKGGG